MKKPIQNTAAHPKKDSNILCGRETVENSPRVQAVVQTPPSQTDPQGSYTGKPADPREQPVQDADDL